MPTFNVKSEKFKLFEDLYHTNLKIHSLRTEEDRIIYFHFFMKGDALETFKNINGPTRENVGKKLAVLRKNSGRKYVKHQSIPTAKHKFQQLVFNPTNQKLVDFLDELQKLANYAFGRAAQAITKQFFYAKKPQHLRKIKKSGQLGKWHIWADCYTPRKAIRAEWFGSPWWATNKYCEP